MLQILLIKLSPRVEDCGIKACLLEICVPATYSCPNSLTKNIIIIQNPYLKPIIIGLKDLCGKKPIKLFKKILILTFFTLKQYISCIYRYIKFHYYSPLQGSKLICFICKFVLFDLFIMNLRMKLWRILQGSGKNPTKLVDLLYFDHYTKIAFERTKALV